MNEKTKKEHVIQEMRVRNRYTNEISEFFAELLEIFFRNSEDDGWMNDEIRKILEREPKAKKVLTTLLELNPDASYEDFVRIREERTSQPEIECPNPEELLDVIEESSVYVLNRVFRVMYGRNFLSIVRGHMPIVYVQAIPNAKKHDAWDLL